MYQCKRSGTVDTISCSQPLGRENQADFLKSVESCFGKGQPHIVFDLGSVPLMDSAGLDALLEGSIVLARPNALCRDILRINEVDRQLIVFEDIAYAMGSFAK